ncbi:anhydro-N-acetylmuramic acid kinase [Portibacter marinus]|uniref:anhydro-N-acetylmuramic acid kinase n=1 Tax=Portibacter marinus TaxID=2898660 RepID=UPI001F3B5FF9|nr:anhydro-N-acetylmuramic acid kinase [Portibacter marinus]
MNILGLMSGSSLDGLDMALTAFSESSQGVISFDLLKSKAVEFPKNLHDRLKHVVRLTSYELFKLEADFSYFLGQCCIDFIQNSKSNVDLIASHGHTVFHDPQNKFTVQIGNGGTISQLVRRDVVCDFRSSDIALGGQGAPFAPIADQFLFPDIDILVNLGGISNISIKSQDGIIAFDVSPANQLLNYLASRNGKAYDQDGEWARSGETNDKLLDKLMQINGLESAKPRGMDNTWVQENFIPHLQSIEVRDGLRTVVEFIIHEITKAIALAKHSSKNPLKIMFTGGGALNLFLMEGLAREMTAINIEIVPAGKELIQYKEAIMIALMGYLRVNRKVNVLNSYTGASRNSIGGCIYAC